jgi:hypothetical protein
MIHILSFKSFTLNMTISKKGKIVPVLNEFKYYAMKAYGGVDV